MKYLLKIALVVIFFITSSGSLFAWGTTGHRVVAEIAERNLSRKAKRNIQKLIGNQSLAYWANWPDFIKSDPAMKFSDTWHYVNVEGNLSHDDFMKELANSSEENLYKKALFLADQLKNNKNLDLKTKQQYLYYIIHMIGDGHQPLHVGRLEDLGGNKVTVEWFGSKTNIHSVWDSKLVDFDKYSFTEYATVLDLNDKKLKKELAEGTLADWIYDSYTIANKIYAEVKQNDDLSYRYHYLNKDILENQMLKGGVRLAKVLNEIYN